MAASGVVGVAGVVGVVDAAGVAGVAGVACVAGLGDVGAAAGALGTVREAPGFSDTAAVALNSEYGRVLETSMYGRAALGAGTAFAEAGVAPASGAGLRDVAEGVTGPSLAAAAGVVAVAPAPDVGVPGGAAERFRICRASTHSGVIAAASAAGAAGAGEGVVLVVADVAPAVLPRLVAVRTTGLASGPSSVSSSGSRGAARMWGTTG